MLLGLAALRPALRRATSARPSLVASCSPSCAPPCSFAPPSPSAPNPPLSFSDPPCSIENLPLSRRVSDRLAITGRELAAGVAARGPLRIDFLMSAPYPRRRSAFVDPPHYYRFSGSKKTDVFFRPCFRAILYACSLFTIEPSPLSPLDKRSPFAYIPLCCTGFLEFSRGFRRPGFLFALDISSILCLNADIMTPAPTSERLVCLLPRRGLRRYLSIRSRLRCLDYGFL